MRDIKPGDTLMIAGHIVVIEEDIGDVTKLEPFSDWKIFGSATNRNFKQTFPLECQIDPDGTYSATLSPEFTRLFKVNEIVHCDIRIETPDGTVSSTETVGIAVVDTRTEIE